MAKKITFEERMAKLEKLVEDLEDGELTLEEAVDHYQRGVKLHKELTGHLERMERKIEILTADGETVPFEGEDGEDGA